MAPVLVGTGDVPAGATVVAVGLGPDLRLAARSAAGVEVDRAFLEAVGFEGRPGQVQALRGPDGRTVLAVGVGRRSAEDLRRAGAALVKAAWDATDVATTIGADGRAGGPGRAAALAALVEGVVLGSYRFGAYRSEPKPCRIQRVHVVGAGSRRLRAELDRAAVVAGAVCLARDLVNEPGGSLPPSRLADRAAEVAAASGLTVEVLDEAAIAEQRLGALLGVAQGSVEPPRLIRLTYEPPGPPTATLVLVGKGITFDSGGLSLKTADGMMAMKTDMSGAAAVIGAMSTLPSLRPTVRVLGIVPSAENMPGGRAIRPGDVVRARNGTTIEVLNTDAEGRLVLADGLCLAAEERPDAIVDVATLTGAQVVALGRRIAGLMGNHDGLVQQVRDAAERAGEPAWPLPLAEVYRPHIDSAVADIKNIGEPGQAGTIIGGLFLQEFVDGIPWAHLDIAGPARSDKADGHITRGGTGWGVRTLVELVTSFTPLDAVPSRQRALARPVHSKARVISAGPGRPGAPVSRPGPGAPARGRRPGR